MLSIGVFGRWGFAIFVKVDSFEMKWEEIAVLMKMMIILKLVFVKVIAEKDERYPRYSQDLNWILSQDCTANLCNCFVKYDQLPVMSFYGFFQVMAFLGLAYASASFGVAMLYAYDDKLLPLSIQAVTMFSRKKQTQNHPETEPVDTDAKVNELRAAIGPLSGRSLKYCTDACLRRYLVARSWNVEKAKKMLEDTLQWRASYKPEEITWPDVAFESETGKVSIANFHDRLGRTVLIMRPGLQNSTSAEGNIRHLFYLIEYAVLNLPKGQEQMVWLIDFTGLSYKNSAPIKTTREIVNILQNHYPERLGLAFLYNPPRLFEAFWKVVKYFLDPITFKKVNFVYPKNKDSVELMTTFFDTENLPIEFGGKATLKYDHEEFSRLMSQSDIKSASYWGLDLKPHNFTNGHAKLQEVPEPVLLAPPAT
ncbi:hypothetical protein QQ045_025155 [Rhodiola kirilowii]